MASGNSGKQKSHLIALLLNWGLALAGTAIGLLLLLLMDLVLSYPAHIRLREQRASAGALGCVGPHEIRHHAFRPGCSGRSVWGADTFDIFTNTLGLRDSSARHVPNQSDKPRILFLGDSFTDSATRWEDSFVGQFAASRPNYEVLNGGLGSYSPSNYYRLTVELLQRGVFLDEVVVMIDASDIQDEAAYYIDEGDRVGFRAITEHRPRFYAGLLQLLRTRLHHVHDIFLSIQRWLIRRGHYLLPHETADNLFDTPRVAWTYSDDWLKLGASPGIDGYAPLGVLQGIRKAVGQMERLHELLSSHGIRLSVGVYPWPSHLVHDHQRSLQVTTWATWCEGRCERFINLFPSFFRAKEKCPPSAPGCWYEKYYIFGDVHLNAAGNALITRQLLRAFDNDPIATVHPRLPPG